MSFNSLLRKAITASPNRDRKEKGRIHEFIDLPLFYM